MGSDDQIDLITGPGTPQFRGFFDGLCGTGEKLVRQVMSGTRMFQQIVGGAAGDEGAFKATHVGAHLESAPDTAAAVHIFDKAQWGIGVDHGLRPTTERMTVTPPG